MSMLEGWVTGSFADGDHAKQAIEALRTRNFDAKDISVVGRDSDEFRGVTAPLLSKYPDRFAVVGTILGIFIGVTAGFYALSQQPSLTHFMAMGPLMAAISGGAAGGLIGCILGAVVNFDNVPFEAYVYGIATTSPNVLISVKVKGESDSEFNHVAAIMEERGATEVRTKLAVTPGAATAAAANKELAKRS